MLAGIITRNLYLLGVYAIRPPLPAVGGGEGVGVVTSVGAKVTTLSKGDWVAVSRPGMGKTGNR